MQKSKSIILGSIDNTPYIYNDDNPLITFIPVGCVKEKEALLRNLSTCPKSMVIVGSKDELWDTTTESRRKIGHTIIRLNPFGTDGASDTFNPFDIFSFFPKALNDTVRQFVSNLIENENFDYGVDNKIQLFTKELAVDIFSGVILYLSSVKPDKFNLVEVRDTFYSDDVVYNLAVVLDTLGKQIDPESYQSISSYLAKTDDNRNHILNYVQLFLQSLGSDLTRSSLSSTSFDLKAIRSGKPFTMYITLPATKLKSHGILLRLWISSLVQLLSDNEEVFPDKVLFVLNHPQYTGDIPFYQLVQNNSKHRNFQLWTFWDSLSQMQKHYPTEWKTIVSSSLIESFGLQHPVVAEEMSGLFGITSQEIRDIPHNEHLILTESNALLRVKTLS